MMTENSLDTKKATTFGKIKKLTNGSRIKLEEPKPLKFETVNLADALDCQLRPLAVQQTFGERNSSNLKTLGSKAALLVGAALAVTALVKPHII